MEERESPLRFARGRVVRGTKCEGRKGKREGKKKQENGAQSLGEATV
jgi:hypothetical protein